MSEKVNGKDYLCLNLEKYLNNKGTTSEDDMKNGNLSIGNSSLPEKNVLLNTEFSYKNIPFFISKKDYFDNIELEGQKLTFKPLPITAIHILGVSSNGDYFEPIHFVRNNEVVNSEIFFLTDFLSSEPAFRDEPAIQCKYLHTQSGINNYYKPTIWYDCIRFDQSIEVDGLQLEDNPFIHIFAISLEYTC